MRTLGWMILMSALAACYTAAETEGTLAKRASFDLECESWQLQYTRIDPRSMGVAGCGRRATYVKSCRSNPQDPQCTWLLNGMVEASVTAPAAAPKPAPAPAP